MSFSRKFGNTSILARLQSLNLLTEVHQRSSSMNNYLSDQAKNDVRSRTNNVLNGDVGYRGHSNNGQERNWFSDVVLPVIIGEI